MVKLDVLYTGHNVTKVLNLWIFYTPLVVFGAHDWYFLRYPTGFITLSAFADLKDRSDSDPKEEARYPEESLRYVRAQSQRSCHSIALSVTVQRVPLIVR